MQQADEIFYDYGFEKIERYSKNKLNTVEYKTDFQFVANITIVFDCNANSVSINGEINKEILQAINKKMEELKIK